MQKRSSFRRDAETSTRAACAPRISHYRKIESAGYVTPFFITVWISEAFAMSSSGFELRMTRSAKQPFSSLPTRAPVSPPKSFAALADPKAALDRIKKTYDVALPNLKKLEDAGVTIAAGTDAGNIGTIHGPALFREFQLMKEAGLTPMQILQCATANAAKLFGGETGANIGKLENGCFADLVILNSNPLDDIAHASDIDTVIKNGVAYSADSILH